MLSCFMIVRFQFTPDLSGPARFGREPFENLLGACPEPLRKFRPGQKHSFPLFHQSRITSHQSLTPLLATHANSSSRKSFVCHSYENNRGRYQLFPKWNQVKGPDLSRLFPPSFLHSLPSLLSLCALSTKSVPQLFRNQSLPHSLLKQPGGIGLSIPKWRSMASHDRGDWCRRMVTSRPTDGVDLRKAG